MQKLEQAAIHLKFVITHSNRKCKFNYSLVDYPGYCHSLGMTSFNSEYTDKKNMSLTLIPTKKYCKDNCFVIKTLKNQLFFKMTLIEKIRSHLQSEWGESEERRGEEREAVV